MLCILASHTHEHLTLSSFPLLQSHGYKAWAEDEALEEAQAAVTEIVLPLGQPVELMPRAGTVLEAQVGVGGTGGWGARGRAECALQGWSREVMR